MYNLNFNVKKMSRGGRADLKLRNNIITVEKYQTTLEGSNFSKVRFT